MGRQAPLRGSSSTYDDAGHTYPTFDLWLGDAVAMQHGEPTLAPVSFGDGKTLVPEDGVELLDQRPSPQMPENFAPPGDRTAVAMVRWQGERWFVLARQLPESPPQYLPTAASVVGTVPRPAPDRPRQAVRRLATAAPRSGLDGHHPAARGGLPVEERSALIDALQELPVMQRKVVVLRHWRGLSVEETAFELGISAGTVKVTPHAASRGSSSFSLTADVPWSRRVGDRWYGHRLRWDAGVTGIRHGGGGQRHHPTQEGRQGNTGQRDRCERTPQWA